MIDTRNWKNYMLGDLFELVNSKAYHNKDVVEVKDENGLLYVTRSKFNNGIKCKVEKKSEYIINPAGTISFGAENADFFYQKKEYITGNKMYYINTCNISELAALFLKSILETTFTKKFSFSNGMVPNRIRNEIISLPAMPDGQPDWTYMESYMKKIMEESEQSLENLKKFNCDNRSIGTRSWGKFCVRDFFKVLKGRSKLSITDINDGNVPVYSSNSKGGIFGYTTKQPDYLITKDTPLYITFGDHTKAINIAEQSFCVMDNVKVLTTELRNRNVLRFIITSWLKNIPNLGYARHWSKAEIAKIYLPITLNGQPDWEYMGNYMKKVIDKSERAISALRAVM